MSYFENDDASIYELSTTYRHDEIRPPVALIYFGILQLVGLVVMLVPGGRAFHWLGYAMGAVLVPATISTYRSVDRTRQRSKFYSAPSWVGSCPSPILALGVALSVAHAYFLALNTRLA